MQGQWIGELKGTNHGRVIVDLDETPTNFVGSAFYFDSDLSLPGFYVELKTPNKDDDQSFVAKTIPLDRLGNLLDTRSVKERYPESTNPKLARISLLRVTSGLEVSFLTSMKSDEGEDISTSASGILIASKSHTTSELRPLEDVNTWEEFKGFAALQEPHKLIFRGQPQPYRLRTSFHRTVRTDLVKYINIDILILHRHLTPITKHLFNLLNPSETGAFYNLIQHHGYPTPLLDWSYSPFIAAFFAFREKPKPIDPASKVRIFLFDHVTWTTRLQQFDRLTYLPPHLSVLELLGIENQRMIPQQALSTLTNIDDIESYIRSQEALALGQQVLFAVDLPVSERRKALDDLSMMGITAASLFPGLDGTCEGLRGRMFGY